MMTARTYFGRYHDFTIDKDARAVLITVSIPIQDGGAALDELAAYHAGLKAAPVAIAMQVGQAAAVLRTCLAPDVVEGSAR